MNNNNSLVLPQKAQTFFSPSEINMWNGFYKNNNLKMSDDEINAKYESRERRILTEINRERLPAFIETLKRPNYIDLQPSYQRRFRWNRIQQSLLIESFIINVPVPPIILYEKAYSSYEVIDGQQRINAINDFYNNRFKLKGLELWSELNGCTYDTLPSAIKAGIDRRSLSSIIVITESAKNREEEVFLKQLAFERLNTGGVDLSKQEVRNCLYQGKFNDLLLELSRYNLFIKAWNIPEKENSKELYDNNLYKKMEDAELILRFFALRHIDEFYRSIEEFMNLYMWKSLNFSDQDIIHLKNIFIQTIEIAYAIYEDNLFKPFDSNTKTWKDKAYKAYYDAVMVGFSNHLDNSDILIAKKSEIIEATKKMFATPQAKLLTGSGKSKSDIQQRIKMFNELLLKIVED